MRQSLQLVAEDFKKIHKLKIQKLKGEYSVNVMVAFNSWLKDVKMWIKGWKLTNLEAVQLIKDYTMDNKLYLGVSRPKRSPQNIT